MNGYTGQFEMIDPRLIVVDRHFQRPLKNTLVQQIAQSPSWEAFGVPVCFKRPNGVLYVADGQQRITGMLKSNDPPKQVPVVWFEMNDVASEAEVFVRINEWRKALLPLEKHRGKLVAGDPAAEAIERALAKVGYSFTTTDSSRNPHNIQAVAGVGVIYNRIGEEGLVQTLTVIRDAFPDDPTGLATHILRGVAELIEEQGENYNRQKLVDALSGVSPAQLLRKADELRFDLGGSLLTNMRRAFKALCKV